MGTEERIAVAALEVLGEKSIDAVTVRDIAARAGVNVATVHYYYRTKEAVVAEGLKRFFAVAVRALSTVLDSDDPPRKKLLDFLVAYSSQFYAHPGVFTSLIEAIVAAGLHQAPDEPNAYQTVLINVIGGAKARLIGLVREITGETDETALVLKTLRMMTSTLHPLLISRLPQAVFGVDFGDETLRLRYLEGVVAAL